LEEDFLLSLILFLLLQGIAYPQIKLTWTDHSDNEDGFVVERTVSEDCAEGWEMIGYTGINQNFLEDIYIPGACYRVVAYNQVGLSPYSEIVRAP
jgi:hypothetical protein